MIVSASYRTDIPAFYSEWFLRRFEAGYARVVNPYGGPPTQVALRGPGVDGFVFWTRDISPFRGALAKVAEAGPPFVVQYTVTGYPRPLEPGVIEADRAVRAIRALAADFGPRVAVWRYDPIVFTESTPAAWHAANFARLAAGLEGRVDEVVISFATLYRKSIRNMTAAGLSWTDPDWPEKQALRQTLDAIAARHGMTLTVCSQTEAGGTGAACVDAARLGVKARQKGNRPGCLCAESRDIGAYDTCPQGCVYCYAVRSRSVAKRRLREHDPDGEFL
ncbi:MAG: DUF1848 domain-containing protein [Alphaproteobacteria bacterium]|nr:DUF1848 domain-containing protein [Alphaproteobacteria bacterium]